MADPFLTRISILAPEMGHRISHHKSRSSEAQIFVAGLLLPLPSAKKTCERVFGVSTHVSKNETWGTRLPGPPAHLYSLCPEIAVELLRFLAVLQSQLLQFPCFGIHKSNLLETRMVVTTYNDHVRLLSPGPWLVGTTKVYPGVGADIVMESITPTTGLGVGCYRQIKLTAVRETFFSEHFDAPFRILAAQSFTSIRFWRVLETLISFMRASSNRESLECKAPLQVSGKDLFSAPVGRLR